MVYKVAILCVVALLVQTIAGQGSGCSCGSGSSSSYRSSSFGSSSGCGCGSGSGSGSVSISNSGGSLLVTSVGPIYPSGISVNSDIGLSGNLDVNGELPFLSAVQFSGEYDTSGSACVDYSCGDCGSVAITSINGGSGCGCGSSCGCGK